MCGVMGKKPERGGSVSARGKGMFKEKAEGGWCVEGRGGGGERELPIVSQRHGPHLVRRCPREGEAPGPPAAPFSPTPYANLPSAARSLTSEEPER